MILRLATCFYQFSYLYLFVSVFKILVIKIPFSSFIIFEAGAIHFHVNLLLQRIIF